jgi:hypothetical protein
MDSAYRAGLRRAPRLDPDTSIAPLITRRGRFARIDPRRPRPLPSLPRVFGVLGWAALTVESLRRAARQRDGEQDAHPHRP